MLTEPSFWAIVVALVSSVVTWAVTIATTRRQLLDHIRECDKRYLENLDKLKRMDDKLDRLIERK